MKCHRQTWQRDAAGCEMRLFLPSCRPTQVGRKRTSLGYFHGALAIAQDDGQRVLLELTQAGGTRAMQHMLPGLFRDQHAALEAVKTLFR